jgi:CRISPR/Cas system-associated endonuclease Cas1
VPLKWIGTGRKPVPASWKTIGPRTTLFRLAGNRHAAHPVNAMLNYAYAVLESQVRIGLVADGYDPAQGIMHETREGSSAFVFDMMEPERPRVDQAVLDFLKANPPHAADFTIRADGVCRLNPEMAKCMAKSVADALIKSGQTIQKCL